MSVKPENRLINEVHKKLKVGGPYCIKLNTPYTAGVPDCYYSGHKGDLWIEWKWLEKLPVQVPVVPDLTPLQAKWLNDRSSEGRKVAVVLGCPMGSVVFKDINAWTRGKSLDSFRKALMTKDQLVEYIISRVGGKTCLSLENYFPPPLLPVQSTKSLRS